MCFHKYEFIKEEKGKCFANYGYEIGYVNALRKIFQCKKCGKEKVKDYKEGMFGWLRI